MQKLNKDEIKKLRKTVRKFLNDKSKSDEEKVNILFSLVAFCLIGPGQISLALNDHEC